MKQLFIDWLLPPSVYQLLVNIKHRNFNYIRDNRFLKGSRCLKDRHRGSRCFILGAGASVKKQNLKKLEGEYVISVSNSFVHPDYHIFHPQYHVLPPLLLSHSNMNEENDFIAWLKEMEVRTDKAELFFHIGDRLLIEKNGLFRNRKIYWNEYCYWNERQIRSLDLRCVPRIWSVSEYAITVALYMDFDKIYLLGFDHDWFKGSLVYFYDPETEHKLKPTSSKISFADSEFQMRRHAYIFRKYKCLYALRKNIYNANADKDSYVDVFPKVNYDSLFQ